MKSIKYYISLIILSALIGCTNNFEEYNENPNVPALWDIDPISLLEQIVYATSGDLTAHTLSYNSELMQYGVNGNTHRYQINNSIMSSVWSPFYDNAGNAEHMTQLARLRDRKDENIEAIGLTMKVLNMSVLTDVYGDVPCKESFKALPYLPYGAESLDELVDEANFNPRFDPQQEIYDSLFTWLDRANSLYIVNQPLKTPAKDLLYQGDVKKWQKFTNSLHLRLLMRLSNRDDVTKVSLKMKEIVENPTKYPLFESNDDNATVWYSGDIPFVNRYATSRALDTRYTAESIINFMYGTYDPRTSCYFVRKGSEWKGAVSGEARDETLTSGVALMNKEALGVAKAPYSFMKYDEVMFILCEAAKRGFIVEGAEAIKDQAARGYYEKAITASIYYWYKASGKDGGVPAETVPTTYIARNDVRYNNTLSRVLEQKYIAMFWVGYEAWCDYRRTGYPKLRIGSATLNDQVLPTRFGYATQTISNNLTNYNEAVDRMFKAYYMGDTMKTPVWWSKQAADIN